VCFLGRLIPSLGCSAVLMKPETIEMRLLLPDFAEQRYLLCYGETWHLSHKSNRLCWFYMIKDNRSSGFPSCVLW
jgi:hypothetical protein